MSLAAVSFPILPGKTEAWHAFVNEMKTTRYDDYVASRKQAGVQERVFLQSTPMGDFVIVTFEGDDAANAIARMAQQETPFMHWFLGKLTELHGLDPSQPMPPMPTLVMETPQ